MSRIAYFKTMRLGDYLQGPEQITMDADWPEHKRSGWAESATLMEKAPSGWFEITIRANMKQGFFNAAETQRQFMGRKLDLMKDFRDVASFGTGYTVKGDLVIVEATADDETTITNTEVGGSAVTVELDKDIGNETSDRVLLVNDTTYEVVRVDSEGSADSFVCNLTNEFNAGDSAFRCLYVYEDAVAIASPVIEGSTPGTNRSIMGLEFKFGCLNDATENL